jgi:hypothetical protein
VPGVVGNLALLNVHWQSVPGRVEQRVEPVTGGGGDVFAVQQIAAHEGAAVGVGAGKPAGPASFKPDVSVL